MERQIKGLTSINTMRKLQQGAIPGDSRGSSQLQLYILENNRALLEKELESMIKRKTRIEEKLKTIDESMASISGVMPKAKAARRSRRPPVRKAESRQKPIQVMKIEY